MPTIRSGIAGVSFAAPLILALLIPTPGVLSAPAAPVPVPREQPVTLRLDPAQGETLTYRFRQDVNLDLPPQFGGGTRAVRARLLLRQTARDVRGDTLRLRTLVREASVDMNGSRDAMNFSRFEGQRFDASVTRRGELVRLEPLGRAPSGVGQVEESVRQIGFPLLPPRPVEVGDAWVDTTRVEAGTLGVPADGDVISVHRTTLERLTNDGGRQVAHLSLRTRFGFEPRRGGMVGMNVETSGSARDTVRFDVDDGKFLSASGRQELVMNLSLPGSSSAFVVRATGRRTAELVP